MAASGRQRTVSFGRSPESPASPGLRETAPRSVPARSLWTQPHDPHGRASGARPASAPGVRYGLGRRGRFGRPLKNAFRFFGFLAPSRALRRLENPRVDGSIPSLATTSNSMNCNGFRASPADHLRRDGANPMTRMGPPRGLVGPSHPGASMRLPCFCTVCCHGPRPRH